MSRQDSSCNAPRNGAQQGRGFRHAINTVRWGIEGRWLRVLGCDPSSLRHRSTGSVATWTPDVFSGIALGVPVETQRGTPMWETPPVGFGLSGRR